MSLPVITIVGRPNVGKSSLLNRVFGSRYAIVNDEPGVTRDRLYARCQWEEKPFILVDTGGIFLQPDPIIGKPSYQNAFFQEQIERQVNIAIEESDLIIFLADAIDGVTPIDELIARKLQRINKPTMLVINKVDNDERSLNSSDFYRLGLGEPLMISVLHAHQIDSLLEAAFNQLKKTVAYSGPVDHDAGIKVAVIGKPNVGKSSLTNTLIGKERAIVSDIAGTTRDALDIYVKVHGQGYTFIDTAGLRKKRKIETDVDFYSVVRTIKAVESADIVLMMVDAQQPVTDQDKHIAQLVEKAGKGLILLINKWDIIPKTSTSILDYEESLKKEYRFIDYAPRLYISATEKIRTFDIYETILKVYTEYSKRISTSHLNNFLQDLRQNQRMTTKGKPLKLYYITQVAIKPPVFMCSVNQAKLIKESHRRFVKNQIRSQFDFSGCPLRISFKQAIQQK